MRSMCGLQRLVLGARSEFKKPCLGRGTGTQAARHTCGAIPFAKMRRKPRIATEISALMPRHGPLPLRTAHLFARPVHSELIIAVGLGYFVLPSRLPAWRADQGDPVLPCAAHQ